MLGTTMPDAPTAPLARPARPRTVGIAVYGLGTVGSAAVTILQSGAAELEAQHDVRFVLRHVVVRDPGKSRAVDVDPLLMTTDWSRPLEDPTVAIVVELMGGLDPAGAIVRRAIKAGKHVITANKALIAAEGSALEAMAEAHGVTLRYEASVGGAIPLIHTLRGTLVGNRITRVAGILNGTTNFILTRMADDGVAFGAALADAQARGFAEADPSSDVSGLDAAQKLVILARHAFGRWVPVECVERTGIGDLTPTDVLEAREAGEVIKLVAEAVLGDHSMRLSVAPRRLPANHSLAQVRDEYNAVQIEGDFAGSLTFIGRGAGGHPTGSAVYDDLVATARAGRRRA
ncbi:MAG TPA: homoserine dehydrogenase [Gemmatimonadaceae bacterium]|nr:homoserine dehydrogenase [Gemmatimonadaceae bacterium]